MRSLILAAGFATRLYPLTKNFPKPLLKVGDETIIDRLLKDIDEIDEIKSHIIITNNIFYPQFCLWQEKTKLKKPILVLNDHTDSNENRLGAVNDIRFVINELNLKEDILVLAGDNVVDFSFNSFVKFSIDKGTSCITCHFEKDISALRKTGVLEVDQEFRVLKMHEKPENPPTNLAVPPFYIYKYCDFNLINSSIEDGCAHDAPGNLASWISQRITMYAWMLDGYRFDIGDLASYEYICRKFENER